MSKQKPFSYTICTTFDSEIFYRQCAALEKHIPGLKKKDRLLEDVDGSLLQKYIHEKGEVIVCNDAPIDVVYVDSDFDLLPYFKKK